jgi:hypothetical protein
MSQERKPYARYIYVRAHQSLWLGDPSERGAQFRQVIMTADAWMQNDGMFQVYALEGTGNGIVSGKLSVDPNPRLLYDQDISGFQAASQKFLQLSKEAEEQGFRVRSIIEEFEFEAKLKSGQV